MGSAVRQTLRLSLALCASLVVLCGEAAADRPGHGIIFGAALSNAMRADQRADLLANFNGLTSENAFKWGEMSPTRGRTDFSVTDRMVAWAGRNRMRLRAHTLFWHRLQMPGWVTAALERSRRPKATLRALMRRRVSTVAGRYAGRVGIWDVVNEPLALLGAGYDTEDSSLSPRNVFFTTLGERYIDDAFRWTHRADPRAKLFLNELVWNPSLGDPKAEALLALVRRLKRRHVPIDGVGIQAHAMLGVAPPWFPPSEDALVRYMRALERLGVKVEITELDVALPLLAGAADPLAAQARVYRLVASACARVRACTGLTVWGLRDPDSWLDTYALTAARAPNRPLLLTGSGARKPAYGAVVRGLMRRCGLVARC